MDFRTKTRDFYPKEPLMNPEKYSITFRNNLTTRPSYYQLYAPSKNNFLKIAEILNAALTVPTGFLTLHC